MGNTKVVVPFNIGIVRSFASQLGDAIVVVVPFNIGIVRSFDV